MITETVAPPSTPALAGRFASMIKVMCEVLTAEGGRGRLSWFWAVVIGTRVRRLGERFASVVARLEAGTLPSPGQGRSGVARAASAPRRPNVLPRTLGWLRRLLPFGTAQLQDLLQEPEMAELVAAAPQARRVLRPLCHMLALRPVPEFLKLPHRPRVRKKPSPASEKEPKPVNVTRLSRLAFANLIHPEREPMGFRPPNRLGYGRAPPLPRDYQVPSKNWD